MTTPPAADTFTCPITTDVVPHWDTNALSCGHRASNGAWRDYLKVAVLDEGSDACVEKRCMQVGLKLHIMLLMIVSDCFHDYFTFLFFSFSARF